MASKREQAVRRLAQRPLGWRCKVCGFSNVRDAVLSHIRREHKGRIEAKLDDCKGGR